MSSIIRADTIQDLSGNNIINESDNTITIGASGDTTNIVGTLQNNGASVGGVNTPLIQAGFTTSSQTISSGADTEIVYTVITKESPTGKFSTSTGRFTPGVTGFYYVSATARLNMGNAASEFGNLQIRVNGSASTSGSTQGATFRKFQTDGNQSSLSIDCIVELTSTSDYISAYIYQNQGGSQSLQPNHTNFTAYKLIT
tara:strand:+ start:194 stop:790 length:597 start_codon:yes stop_codon:yes gene_type:complete